MTEWLLLGIAVVLIAANAVFVAAEFAFVTVDRATVERRAQAGDRRSASLQGDDGDLVGYVHVKDLLGLPLAERDQPVDARWIRPLATVSAEQPLREVLSVMQNQGAHLARVTEPRTGSLLGLAALEDVIEELVGEVRDATQHPAS